LESSNAEFRTVPNAGGLVHRGCNRSIVHLDGESFDDSDSDGNIVTPVSTASETNAKTTTMEAPEMGNP
jgi:hypothetical protein